MDEEKPTRFELSREYDWLDILMTIATGIRWLVVKHTLKAGLIPIVTMLLGGGSAYMSLPHILGWESKTEIVPAAKDTTTKNVPKATEIVIAGEVLGYEDPTVEAWKLANVGEILVHDFKSGMNWRVMDKRLSSENLAVMAKEQAVVSH